MKKSPNTSDHIDESADKLRPHTDNNQQQPESVTGAEKARQDFEQELGTEQARQDFEKTEHRESTRNELDDIIWSVAGDGQSPWHNMNTNNLNPTIPLYADAEQWRKASVRVVEEKTKKALQFFRMSLAA